MDTTRQLALLIDGDNAQAALLPQILEEVNKHGTPIIRHVYGDWTASQMKSWKNKLNKHAIEPIQQFRYTKGKNITDIALIIDAMEFLYTAEIDGFCLASSDSDYTLLATRIRKKGLFVLGIGRASTPESFRNACDVFVSTKDLPKPKKAPAKSPAPPAAPQTVGQARPTGDARALKKLLKIAFERTVQDDGWAALGGMGDFLRQLDPGFDSRAYGHKQLSQLVEAYPDLMQVKKTQSNGGTIAYYVRMKGNTQPIEKLLATAFEQAVQDDGWAPLTTMGGCLRKIDPGFDPRTYGHKLLSQLVEAYPELFKVKKSPLKGGTTAYYVRMKKP